MFKIGKFLEQLSLKASSFAGSSAAFTIALSTVLIWAVSGPFFHYSEMWQLIINTGTTIVTFLMVFLIQRAQNKDILSIHAKLNELIAAQEGASNKLVNIEDASEEELLILKQKFEILSSENEHTESMSISQLNDVTPIGPPYPHPLTEHDLRTG